MLGFCSHLPPTAKSLNLLHSRQSTSLTSHVVSLYFCTRLSDIIFSPKFSVLYCFSIMHFTSCFLLKTVLLFLSFPNFSFPILFPTLFFPHSLPSKISLDTLFIHVIFSFMDPMTILHKSLMIFYNIYPHNTSAVPPCFTEKTLQPRSPRVSYI